MQVIDKDICFKLTNETTNVKDAITPGVPDLLDIFAINWAFDGRVFFGYKRANFWIYEYKQGENTTFPSKYIGDGEFP